MTVTSETARNVYTASGSTDTYDYTFRILRAEDLLVTVRDLDGDESVLAYGDDYTVTGAGLAAGGTIVLTAGNLTAGHVIALSRGLEFTQQTDLRNQGPYFAETQERVYDRLTMLAQENRLGVARALKAPLTDETSESDLILPPATLRAGKALAFDGLGRPIVMAGLPPDLSHALDVRAFGAAGDGSTDDAGAIQAACNAAASYSPKRTVYFPAGVYLIGSPINLSGASLQGESRDSVILRAPAGMTPFDHEDWIIGPRGRGNDRAIVYAVAHDDWTISDLTLDGNGSYTAGIMAIGGDNIAFVNMRAMDTANSGLQFFGEIADGNPPVTNSRMVNCISERNRWNYVVDGSTSNVLLANNVSKDALIRHFSIDPLESSDDPLYGLRKNIGILIAGNLISGNLAEPHETTGPGNVGGAINLKPGVLGASVIGNIIRNWGATVIPFPGSHTPVGINLLGYTQAQVRGNVIGNDAESELMVAGISVLGQAFTGGGPAPGTVIAGNAISYCNVGINTADDSGEPDGVPLVLDGNTFLGVTTPVQHPDPTPANWRGDNIAVHFVPTFTFETPGDLSVSYTMQYGRMVRSGRLVDVHIILNITPTFTTSSGQIRIEDTVTPAPDSMTASRAARGSVVGHGSAISYPAGCTFLVASKATTAGRWVLTAGGSEQNDAPIGASNITSGSPVRIEFCHTYICL